MSDIVKYADKIWIKKQILKSKDFGKCQEYKRRLANKVYKKTLDFQLASSVNELFDTDKYNRIRHLNSKLTPETRLLTYQPLSSEIVKLFELIEPTDKKYYWYRAISNPNMIAYLSKSQFEELILTNNEVEYLCKNGVMTKLGKFVKSVCPTVKDNIIRDFCTKHIISDYVVTPIDFKYGYNEDNYCEEIQEVYDKSIAPLNGSCMKEYHKECATFYSQYDCKLYGILDSSKRVCARAIVWEDKYLSKIYAISYEHAVAIINWADSKGYIKYGEYKNIKVRVSNGTIFDTSIAIPYVDGFRYIDACGTIGNASYEGTIRIDNADMASYDDSFGPVCAHCGRAIDEYSGVRAGDDLYCDHDCAVSDGWEFCEECKDYYSSACTMVGGDIYVCEYCLDRYYFRCDECGEYFRADDTDTIDVGNNTYCSEYCAENANNTWCVDCRDWFENDELVENDGDWICSECNEKRKEDEDV